MSLSPQDAPWSAEQQGWLAALGYTVWVAGAPASADAGPVETAAPQAAAPGRAEAAVPPTFSERPGHASGRAPATRVAPSPEPPPAPERARAVPPRARPASRLPDRLHFALIRASGCNPNAEGAAEIFAQWPSSSELRGNPAAKRALWPRLRALRRPSTP